MDRPVAYEGSVRLILYARALDGSHPAKQFFDALPEKIKRRFAVAFRKLGDTGKLFNKEQFKAVEGSEFYEFKCHRYRLFCRFIDGGVVLLTNGCEKKKDKLDPEELRRAENIYEGDKLASEGGSRKKQ
ncbi:MAG: type II toxin-antitoxin system RelE/ParE family toxin [Bryobacteraceae bacterium]|jgi:hypothetical protein